ncbi:cupin domain-containing protein [Kribbella sp. NPDC050124]|uniref:cupin domain-containing protein n=1 Tax=Kribbella sp. NPDC050124 TaxID=3364114 RepID=UPI0037A36F21
MTGRAHVVQPAQGRSVDLGVARMRVLADSTVSAAFSLTEFAGTTEGAWTVPHLHRGFEESFFVLDGEFTFTVGGEAVVAGPGTYVLVGRDTAHTITAGPGGGRFLTLMVPGGLEEMFIELGELPPNAITDPVARKAVSARYDSIPTTSPA